MNNPRVVFVFATSVTTVFLDELIFYLKKKGHQLTIVCSNDDEVQKYCETKQIGFHPIHITRSISPLEDLISIFQLFLFFREYSPDIVHCFTPKGSLIGILASFLAKVPIRINHIMGIYFFKTKRILFVVFKLVEKVICNLSTVNLVVSNSCRQELLAMNLCPENKLRVPRYGSFLGIDHNKRWNLKNFDEYEREEFRSEHGLSRNGFNVGFVGRLNIDKGLGDFLLIYRSLQIEIPELSFIIIGELDSDRSIDPSLKKILEMEGVIFTGWLQKPEYAIAELDILLHPSKREGFGNVIIEAASLEIPSIAYDIPGVRDAIIDGETGLLGPEGDWRALKELVCHYYNNKAIRKEHGENARRNVINRFSSAEVIEEIYENYYQLEKTIVF